MIEDIRTKPGILGPAASALVNHRPPVMDNSGRLGHEPASFPNLPLVVAVCAIDSGMLCDVKATCKRSRRSVGNLAIASTTRGGIRCDEFGVVVENPDLVDRRSRGSDGGLARAMSSRYWRQLE